MSEREAFDGRMWAVVNVESDDPTPLMILAGRGDADNEVRRRRALPSEHEDHLDEYYQIFPVDVVGAWWNSYEPDPRAANRLTLVEIVREHLEPGESIIIARDSRPPSPGPGWAWDDFAKQWYQRGAKGPAIAPTRGQGA